jgi:hypothetical protein
MRRGERPPHISVIRQAGKEQELWNILSKRIVQFVNWLTKAEADMMGPSRTNERAARTGSAKAEEALMSDEAHFKPLLQQMAFSIPLSAPTPSGAPALTVRLRIRLAVIMETSPSRWSSLGGRILSRRFEEAKRKCIWASQQQLPCARVVSSLK